MCIRDRPVIENAIIHGLEPKIEKGKVSINISIQDEFLTFLVEDNGVGMDLSLIHISTNKGSYCFISFKRRSGCI